MPLSWAVAMDGGVLAQSVTLPAGVCEAMDMQHRTKEWNTLGKVVLLLFSAGLAVAIVHIVVFVVTRD